MSEMCFCQNSNTVIGRAGRRACCVTVNSDGVCGGDDACVVEENDVRVLREEDLCDQVSIIVIAATV